MWNFNTHRNRYVPVPSHGIKGTKSVRNIKEKIRNLFHVWLTSSPAVLSHRAAGRKPGLELSRSGDCQGGVNEEKSSKRVLRASLSGEIVRRWVNQQSPRSRRTDRVGEEKDG